MSRFDTVIVVDWSAANTRGAATPQPDRVWSALWRGGEIGCDYHRTRAALMAWLIPVLEAERTAGRRVLAGFDFPFAYPKGFVANVTGSADPLQFWEWLDQHIEDAEDNQNNRFDVAKTLNQMFPGVGPFWGCPAAVADEALPAQGTARHGHGMTERRQVEQNLGGAQPCWKLFTTGSVGSQALVGLPRLNQLRRHFGDALTVSPFQPPTAPIVLAEVFPSLLAPEIAARRGNEEINDRAQVRVLAEAMAELSAEHMDRLLRKGDPEEGWIFGVGDEAVLRAALPPVDAIATAAAAPVPPPLRNDCFALPAGVEWVPVDDALAHLRDKLACVSGAERLPVQEAADRVLAEDVMAKLSNPPHPNTAVDGYGFAGGRAEGPHVLPLVSERATAGALPGAVPEGSAIRVLTGARLPEGVDTVVLQEDVTVAAGQVAFNGPVKQGANTRRAGEDVVAEDVILRAGRRLTPADLALASAAGLGNLPVRARLRVGVLSTGDELLPAGTPHAPGRIYDANRPMLLALLEKLGHAPVDLGHVRDDRAALRAAFDAGAARCDAMLTSGGASAGDEDHVSALLSEAGAMELWRIAVKPGRPLALGLWQGAPVFGLPGNPVAALVCALVFARPALGVLAGQDWQDPQGFAVPAGFAKSKKPGRREFLRARLRDGVAERFASEGSGRISGLSWAEGLIELPDGAVEIKPGDPVRYIPYSSFLS